MSWLNWVKTKFAGTPASDDGRDRPGGANAGPRDTAPSASRSQEQAIAKLTKKIAALPDGADKLGAYFERGVAYKEVGDLRRALADLARVAAAVPSLADVHGHCGECFLRLDDHARAIDSLDRAIALLPAGVPLAISYINRGKASAAVGEIEAALADFARAEEIAPRIATIAREEADKVRNQGTAASATRPRPSSGERCTEGAELDAQGDVLGALVAFGKAIDLEPTPKAYYGRGIANCKLRRYPQAIADLDRAVALRPRYAAAITERGLAYVNSGDIERGIAEYDAAIAIEPAYAVAHENKGTALLLQERWADAVPYLDTALRLAPRRARIRYHRGIAHEMLGDLPRALRDLEESVKYGEGEEHAHHAQKRLASLRPRAGGVPAPQTPAPEDLWPMLTGLSLDDTVADLVRRVHAEGKYFGQIALPDGSMSYADFYGEHGFRKRLTEIADVIGPRILTLKLGQFHDLLAGPPSGPPPASDGPADVEVLIEGSRINVLTHGERLLGVFSGAVTPGEVQLPTVLFGERPIFGRTDQQDAQRCSSCQRAVAYFDAVLDADKLTGYACPHCGQSPVPGWIELRMRPGGWSQVGFLGETDRLRDVILRDEQTLERLGVSHGQIADALDRLLTRAFEAGRPRFEQASLEILHQLEASGQRGFAGLAALPLGATLDELERLVRNGDPLPIERGTAVDGHDVYLQLYGGCQYCPYTLLRLPWSDDAPARRVIRRRIAGAAYVSEPIDRELPCSSTLSYRHANVEFLIVRRDDRRMLRGSGLMVHLIRDHRFFEGEHSPFRLDPEQAARVLGLA
jgi:tetratricopeptide (TPR) repeat protein